jgi:hypothetical protein
LHEAKLAKMETEMKMVFQQKVQEKEAKLKQSEEELYARHKEMKDALEKQRADLEDKKRKIESGRPLTPEKINVSFKLQVWVACSVDRIHPIDWKEEGFPPCLAFMHPTSVVPSPPWLFIADTFCAPPNYYPAF